jgi:hypothetical protein
MVSRRPPPFVPHDQTLGKRKRDEQSPPGGSTSSDRVQRRGLADNDALASIVCSVSSQAGDTLPSQHVQYARPELGAVPCASPTRVYLNAETLYRGTIKPEAATPGKSLTDVIRERIIAVSANEQSEIPWISTDNR